MQKGSFYYSRSERRGILVLIALIIIVMVGGCLISIRQEKKEIADNAHAEKEYADFNASLRERKRQETVYRKPEFVKRTYAPVNRKFEKKKDATKQIDEQVQTLPSRPAAAFKYPPGTVIDLNQADTTELRKIPGIGNVIAKRIVEYRRKLGGFYDVNQLKDIHSEAEQWVDWFVIEAGETQRINLNKAGVERLRAHPYFNFYQAKAIAELRKKKGMLNSLKQLALYEEFTEKDFERMEPYICFE